ISTAFIYCPQGYIRDLPSDGGEGIHSAGLRFTGPRGLSSPWKWWTSFSPRDQTLTREPRTELLHTCTERQGSGRRSHHGAALRRHSCQCSYNLWRTRPPLRPCLVGLAKPK